MRAKPLSQGISSVAISLLVLPFDHWVQSNLPDSALNGLHRGEGVTLYGMWAGRVSGAWMICQQLLCSERSLIEVGDFDLNAAVLRATFLGVVVGDRFVGTEADGRQSAGIDACLLELLDDALGALLREVDIEVSVAP